MKLNQKFITIISFLITIIFMFISFLFDKNLIQYIENSNNFVLNYLFYWSNFSFFLIIICFLFGLLYLWNIKKKEFIIPSFITFIVTFFSIIFINLIVARDSPLENLNILFSITKYSFPCIFVAICFSLVGFFQNVSKKLLFFWLIFGIIIGISKIILIQNYLSDILAGMIIGYVIGFLVFYITKKNNLFGV